MQVGHYQQTSDSCKAKLLPTCIKPCLLAVMPNQPDANRHKKNLFSSTMITFQEARQIAQNEINRQQALVDDSLIILDDQIIEKDYAWIFPYTSKKYWETNDINHAIGGNGPLFVSKLNGQISNYRTGLSIEGMIDEYEEENKIWFLTLTDDIFTDTTKTLSFRQTLGLTVSDIAGFKKNISTAFESGSRTRLEKIKNQLLSKDITTSLTQSVITNNAGT
ncbi:MAG: hypothetical protein JST86_20070 [Bacteroidetes bacterium]|nr:hypothetical protein [Bacteroidota bacterium]